MTHPDVDSLDERLDERLDVPTIKWPPHTNPRATLARIDAANVALREAARALTEAFDDAPSEIANDIVAPVPVDVFVDGPAVAPVGAPVGATVGAHAVDGHARLRAHDVLDLVARLTDLTCQAVLEHLDTVATAPAMTTTAPGFGEQGD